MRILEQGSDEILLVGYKLIIQLHFIDVSICCYCIIHETVDTKRSRTRITYLIHGFTTFMLHGVIQSPQIDSLILFFLIFIKKYSCPGKISLLIRNAHILLDERYEAKNFT